MKASSVDVKILSGENRWLLFHWSIFHIGTVLDVRTWSGIVKYLANSSSHYCVPIFSNFHEISRSQSIWKVLFLSIRLENSRYHYTKWVNSTLSTARAPILLKNCILVAYFVPLFPRNSENIWAFFVPVLKSPVDVTKSFSILEWRIFSPGILVQEACIGTIPKTNKFGFENLRSVQIFSPSAIKALSHPCRLLCKSISYAIYSR